MKQYLYISLVLFFILVQTAKSQDLTQKIVPPTPEAAALARYGEIPVDYSTGIPKIEIPIYTIESGGLQLPISISYHASGIKANDVSTTVGLGWVLNAGGVIARTIIGGGDQSSDKFYKSAAEISAAIQNTTTHYGKVQLAYDLDNHIKRIYDTQSDRYSYNFNGHTGIFRYNFLLDSDPLCIPYEPIKIKKVPDPNHWMPFNYEIIDENGILYSFKNKDKSNPTTSEANCSWFLSEIISSNQLESIKFHYRQGDDFTTTNSTSRVEFGCNDNGNTCSINNTANYTRDNGYLHHTTILLDSIVSSTTVVIFEYANSDLDIKRSYRLKKIQIIAKSGRNILKEVVLNHSSFGLGEAKRLRLDGLNFYGTNVLKSEKYSFKYNSIELPPYEAYHDYWGYYNGHGSMPDYQYDKVAKLIPLEYLRDYPINVPLSTAVLYGGDRNPNPHHMQACMLTEIGYPTGGKTVFQFESNRTSSNIYDYINTNNGVVGGLRVKSITSYNDMSTVAWTKSYEYSDGDVYFFNGINNYVYQKMYSYNYLLYNEVMGMEVYKENWENPFLIFISSPLYSNTTSGGVPVIYSKVTEYMGDKISNIGKTEYSYEWDRPMVYEDVPLYWTQFHFDRGNGLPRLKEKNDYKYEGGLYKKVHSTSNSYVYYKSNLLHTGINIYHQKNWVPLGDNLEMYPIMPYNSEYIDEYLSDFIFSDTKAYEDVPMLDSSQETIYFEDNQIASFTTCYYNIYTLPSMKKNKSSDNRELITSYKYPHDFSSSSTIYNSMVQKNIISPVIEETKTTGQAIELLKTNYFNPSGNIYVPQTVQQTIGTTTTTKLTYNSYDDKGNVTQYTGSDGVVTTILWGYNKTYPVAKVVSGSPFTISETIRTNINNRVYCGTDIKSEVDGDITFLSQQLSDYIGNNTYQVALYTYKPLVGMTSETNANGNTSSGAAGITNYYSYDSFGRLSEVRDDEGNLLKKHSYNYANQ